jgi:hypothetical protein
MHRLPITRMAITVPPDDWFRGIARALFDRYRQALVDLGVAVFDVPVDLFLSPDAGHISTLISELRAFQPTFAFGLPVGSYALLCRLPPLRDGSRPNLFTDVFDLPTICLWDHAPVELADQLLAPHPQDPTASARGGIDALRRVLTHPRLIHWSRDSGQTRIMRELGFLLLNHLIEEMPPALPGFERVETVSPAHDADTPNVAFIGHVYQEPRSHPCPPLSALAADTIHAFTTSCRTPFWHLLRDRIGAMPADLREQLALDADQTYFWRFAHQLICHEAQTSFRLTLLGAAGVPVACYGNLRTDLPGVPSNLRAIPCGVPYGPRLAELFARHPITIDVLSPGFVDGYSHKQVHGFATGGFMLINWKQDFVDVFGEAGAAVSCVGADDLAAKVDLFLTKPKYRREVGDAIRDTVAARFQLNDGLARALDAAYRCADAMGWSPTSMKSSRERGQTVPAPVVNLLSDIRSEPYWSDASVQHGQQGAVVSTASLAWAYAAVIPIPARVHAMREPCLRLIVRVEEGRIGVAALMDATGALLSEQLVSPTADPVELTVELPHEGAGSVIVRNTVERASRALVLDASLCDRPPWTDGAH